MFRRNFLSMLAPVAILISAESAAAASTLTVTKAVTCDCCSSWVEHMRKAGFSVMVREVDDVTPTKIRLGVPNELRSCHTSEIAGYVIEGHVPAADVKRLIAIRSKAAGIALPGMVAGSPGMEGGRRQPYQTILFRKSGKTSVFASR